MADVSRIKLGEEAYDIKDALNRHNFNVLIGVEPPDGDNAQAESENNSDKE